MDHQNLSTIINNNLLEDPGLHRTLIGDGLADVAGAFLGGCSTTSYGESLACVALTKNASTVSIFTAAIMAIVVSFIGPVSTLLSTIPSCVLNAVCFLLYGFIAVSGLKMIKNVDLEDNRNVFVVSVILIAGVGGLSLEFGSFTITTVACSLILGIITNLLVSLRKPPVFKETFEPLIEDIPEELTATTVNTSVRSTISNGEYSSMLFAADHGILELYEVVGLLGLDDEEGLASERVWKFIRNKTSLESLKKDTLISLIETLNTEQQFITIKKSYTKQQLIESILTYVNSLER